MGGKTRGILGALACGAIAVAWLGWAHWRTPGAQPLGSSAPGKSLEVPGEPASSAGSARVTGAWTAPDRIGADRVRAQLRALARAEAQPASAASGASNAHPAAASGYLAPGNVGMPAPVGSGNQAREASGRYIRSTVHEQFLPMAGGCYDELLHRRPGARGRFDLSVVIGGNLSVGGVVEEVRVLPDSTLTDDSFVTCMVESMMALQFDAPPNGSGRVDFTYPFELAPDEPDAAPTQVAPAR